MSVKTIAAGLTGSVLVGLGMPLTALAASNTVVSPTNTQGWSSTAPLAETDPGGAVNLINDSTAPAGVGALQLTTDATPGAKAQYLHAADTPLSAVNSLSYYTKQVAAPFAGADASYQLPVFLNGTTGFTTLVYEPYQNTAQGTVTSGTWQKWDVASGLFWSTHSITCSNGTINGSAGGPASYTLAQIKAACPSATVIEYGVNIGSNNPGYNVETDLLNFNGTTYNFEPTVGPPTSLAQCLRGSWQTFNNPAFSSQSDCLNYVLATANGNLVLANPHQKITFNLANQKGVSLLEDIFDGVLFGKKSTVEYWNYDYAGGTLHYTADVMCTNINPATGEARFMFQIPAGHPGLSGLYVVAYAKDVSQKGAPDLYGHAATADLATATAWCQTGIGFTPTMYQVTSGKVSVD